MHFVYSLFKKFVNKFSSDKKIKNIVFYFFIFLSFYLYNSFTQQQVINDQKSDIQYLNQSLQELKADYQFLLENNINENQVLVESTDNNIIIPSIDFDNLKSNVSSNLNINESHQNVPSIQENNEKYLVTRVIDGDTIEIEGGQRVRLIGIDTPETVNPNTSIECYGIEASNKTKELLQDKYVTLKKDVSNTDRYNRLLRYVYLDNLFINDFLVKNGYAVVSTYPPDVEFVSLFTESEKYAKDNNLGLWSIDCTTANTSTTNFNDNNLTNNSNYTCNCSKSCGSMSSCEEAMFQLNTCGCYQRDGDRDGIPCESLCR